MQRPDCESYRKRMSRAYELPLLYAVMAFQFVSMLLLAFRDDAVDGFSLYMCALLPLGTWTGLSVLKRFFPIDRVLYILTAFLASLSVILLRAVSSTSDLAKGQAPHLLIGFVAMLFGIVFIRALKSWRGFCLVCMIPCLALLAMPMAFHSSTAQNWVYLGPVQFQPSEFVKPALCVILASGFSCEHDIRYLLRYLIFSALCCIVLVIERDFGAVILYFSVTMLMFYTGTHRKLLTFLILGFVALLVAVLLLNLDAVIKAFPKVKYVRERIGLWQNPWNGEWPNANQIIQGLIAVASGGLFGAGLGLGSSGRIVNICQDYIFVAVCEEFGMIFAIALLALYICVLLRAMSVAASARRRFYSLVVFGCVSELILQTLLIVSGNLLFLPLTGVTMPFLAEGGSSLAACMAQMGLILGVSSLNAQDEYDDLCRLNGRTWEEDSYA